MAEVPSAQVAAAMRSSKAPGGPTWAKRILILLGVLYAGYRIHYCIALHEIEDTDYTLDRLQKETDVDSIMTSIRYGSDPTQKAKYIAALRPKLKGFQDTARAHLKAAAAPHPEGLDRIFAALLARTDNEVTFVADPPTMDKDSFTAVAARLAQPGVTVASFETDILHQAACGNGIADAFHDALGSSVIHVAYELTPLPLPNIKAKYAIRATGDAYTTSNGLRIFPGIHLTGSLELVDAAGTIATVPIDDDSPSAIKFTSDAIAMSFEGAQDEDVGYALVRATCKLAGYRLVSQLTGWKPPRDEDAPATAQDHIDACEAKGDSGECNEAGIALRDGADGVTVDSTKAEAMFKQGCDGEGIASGEACVNYSKVALPKVKDAGMMRQPDYWAEIMNAVEHACERHSAIACTRRGELQNEPDWKGRMSEASVRLGAIDWFARGCVLGDPEGCWAAAALTQESERMTTAGTVLPDAAAAFLRHGCQFDASHAGCDTLDAPEPATKRIPEMIRDFALGKDSIIDVGWADWSKWDEGHAVYYVASKDPADSVATRLGDLLTGGDARLYSLDTLPYGVTAAELPKGTQTLYAVFARTALGGKPEDRCNECTGEPTGRYDTSGCTCLPLSTVK